MDNINPTANGSNPHDLVEMNGLAYFAANDGVHGVQLWQSNGTSAGTTMITDINPGTNAGINPHYLTNVGGTLFFAGNDGVDGTELWKSNGTLAGTSMVSDINPGKSGSFPHSLTNVNGTLFFAANDVTDGIELWTSNGSAAGTVLVSDINPGTNGSSPQYLTNVGGTLFFTANDGTDGTELWKSNGTVAGTVMVSDINAGSAGSNPNNLTNVNGTLFFAANDGVHGNELWSSNGTGVYLVSDINPSSASSNPTHLTNVNGTLFFAANDGVHGDELWTSNGAGAGTVLVSDINPSPGQGSYPFDLTSVGGAVYFGATDGTDGIQLWTSNGTAAGTQMLSDIPVDPTYSGLGQLTEVSGALYFQDYTSQFGAELWQSNGTTAGTVMVADINPQQASSYPSYLTNVGGTMFFAADDGVHGTELWDLEIPIITAPAAASVSQNGSLPFTGSNAISVTDLAGTAEQMTLQAGNGTLSLASTTGLNVTGQGTPTLTISGALANLDSVLAGLTYVPTPGYHGSDTISLSDTDTSDNLTASTSVAINVTPLPPSFTAPLSFSVNQGATFSFTGANSVSVNDPSGSAEQLTLKVAHGSLSLASTLGLTVTGNGTADLVIAGSLSNLNSALAGLTYISNSNYHGSDVLSLFDRDTSEGMTFGEKLSITVKPVAPTLTAPASISVPQNATFSFIGPNAVSVNDPSGTAEQLTLKVAHGTLSLTSTSGVTVTGNGTAAMKITGSLSNLNSVLAGLTYSPPSGYHGSDVMSLFIKDTSDSLSFGEKFGVTVTPLAPTYTAPSTISVAQNSTLSFTGANAISVNDLSGTAEQLTLKVAHGTLSLSSTSGVTVTGNGTAAMMITGSLSNLNSVLASLTYAPASGYHASDIVSLYDKDTSDNLTVSMKIPVSVTPLAPTFTAPTSASVARNTTLSFMGANAISVNDPSGTTEQLTLKAAHGTLSLGSTNGVTVTGNGTADLVITGLLTNLNDVLASLSYTPTPGYFGSDVLSLYDKDTSDNLAGPDKIGISVT